MNRKTGLLPKCLFLSIIVRIICIISNTIELSKPLPGCRYLNYLNLAASCMRLFGIIRTNLLFYVIIATSYIFELTLFFVSFYLKCISKSRLIVESIVSIFSVLWMIFLYPYYLIKTESRSKTE